MTSAETDNAARETRAGLLLGLSAYLLWGVMPVYFKALAHVPPGEILGHRIIWSLLFLAALASAWRLWPTVRDAVARPRLLLLLVATAALISVNWLVYIIAVVSGHVLEGSLGYYLNPLINVVLGVVVLKERLSRAQWAAIALAGGGVGVLAAGASGALWISLTLAVSFATYGFLRKVAPVDAVAGLTIETLMLTPFALGWLLWLEAQGQGGFSRYSGVTTVLLVLGGAITAIPLLLFTAASKRLPYSTLGFLQYVAPTLQFLSAVLLFGEAMTTAHLVCFGAIWAALVIFSVDGWLRLARGREEAAESLA